MITLSAFWPVFNRQKPWDTDFTVQSWNEAHKNSAQNYPKIHGQTKGGGPGRSHNLAYCEMFDYSAFYSVAFLLGLQNSVATQFLLSQQLSLSLYAWTIVDSNGWLSWSQHRLHVRSVWWSDWQAAGYSVVVHEPLVRRWYSLQPRLFRYIVLFYVADGTFGAFSVCILQHIYNMRLTLWGSAARYVVGLSYSTVLV